MDRTLLADLADRFLAGTATEQEKALLHEWFDGADREEIELVFLSQRETEEQVKARMLAGLMEVIEPVGTQPQGSQPQVLGTQPQPRRIGRYVRWIAAASILMAVGLSGLYYWNVRKAGKAADCCGAPVASAHKDLSPGGNKATLLLGDGSVVNLGIARNGVIRRTAGAVIDKKDGQLIYSVSTAAETAPEMNTIQTPRGGQYQVILPDGTSVWLNAASSLSYPTAFTGKERQVQLKGEAYFEVAENKDKPFRVVVGDMQVNVLGTHFNVMAYDDENAIKTTLLEGSVKVTKGMDSHMVVPGQEAALDRSSGVFKTREVDVDAAVAWKNGVFQFGGSSIETVMREIARWYDVEVEYQGRTDEHFTGTISRGANASEVFKMLELTGAVHFNIEGKRVIVRP